MLDDTRIQILHEHYRDTFINIRDSIKLRDRLTMLVIFVLALLVFCAFWPADAIIAFSQMTLQKIGAAININAIFLGNIIWFALLAAVIRYLQVVVYIERQYAYIYNLEKELNKNYTGEILFTRESKSYLNKYPAFSNWTCFLYTKIFPFILACVVILKGISEWINYSCNFFPILLNNIMVVSIVISIVLYMRFMSKQDNKL